MQTYANEHKRFNCVCVCVCVCVVCVRKRNEEPKNYCENAEIETCAKPKLSYRANMAHKSKCNKVKNSYL